MISNARADGLTMAERVSLALFPPLTQRDTAIVGFTLVLAVLIVGSGLSYTNVRRQTESRERLVHSLEVIVALESVLSTLKDGETGQRGYLITGDPGYLEPFNEVLARVQTDVSRLATLTSDNPEQRARISDLQPVIERRVDELRQSIALVQRGESAAAVQLMRSDAGKLLMDDVRARVATLEGVEQDLLRERTADVAARAQLTLYSILLTMIVEVGLVAAVFGLVRRNAVQRQHAAEAVAEQREQLRVTLASIGDAVLTTDTNGRITGMNAVAESLTGWPLDAVIGRSLETAFNIVNEESRQVVPSPVTRALEQGAIVGLANHTILIRRDGSERPIEDSAAPIRNAASDIIGCVLVFHDISERARLDARERQLLAEAAAANAKFHALFEQGPLFAGFMTTDGVVNEANRLSWAGCGYEKEQVIGKPFWEGPWWASPDNPLLRGRLQAACALAASGETFRAELPYYLADGSERCVDLVILPITDADGRVAWLSQIGVDITERNRAEGERRKLVSLAENSTDFIGMCDNRYIPFFVNRAGLQMVGLDTLDEAIHTPVQEFFFPEDRPTIFNEFFPAVLEQGTGEIEIRFRHFKTGEALWVLYRVFALRDATGAQMGLATVSRDISERKGLEDNLRYLAADLSDANRRKDEFLATLAHELRNPLAPLRTGLQILRLSDRNDPAAEQARTMMERQLAQMVRLVDDLLDVSRISRGTIELRKQRVNLADVIEHAVETSRPLIDLRGHSLTVHMPEEPMAVTVDPTRVGQVLANLLNNAAKYTAPGGRIDVIAERSGNTAVIHVRDNGEGIAPGQLTAIFDLFTQVGRSSDRSETGLGIGLAIAKRLIQMHDGTLEASSEGVGKGTEFVIRLPGAETFVADTVLVDQVSGGPPGVDRRRILVADDNEDAATVLALLLTCMGHDVRTAHDGLEAVATAEAFQPELMFLDIGMPKANGYEVCRRIRAQPWGRTATLVALTGWGQAEDKRRSQEAGFDAHLVKPADVSDVEKLLARLSAERGRVSPETD